MKRAVLVLMALFFAVPISHGQGKAPAAERVYDAPVERVQQALQQADMSSGGKLPGVEGFVPADVDQRDHYQRPHYEFRVEAIAVDATHAKVRVQAQISAWFADTVPGRSEYRSLPSNGRLESDLLDRLQDSLGGSSAPAVTGNMNSSVRTSDAAALMKRELENLRQQRQALEAKSKGLTVEVAEWDERIHQRKAEAGFATVRRSGAAVMARMSYSGPVLFRTRAEDEFEALAQEKDWIQVRTGHDSTGWMLAGELVLPAGMVLPKPSDASAEAVNSSTFGTLGHPAVLSTRAVPVPGVGGTDLGQPGSQADSQANLGFWISREDVNSFSGEWTKLKGKRALFVFVKPRGLLSGMASDDRKLAFAKALFTSRYLGAANAASGYEGIVVIFSGGKNAVAAALVADIREWAAGKISEAEFMQRCSLDPADEFRSSEAVASSAK